MSGEKNNAAMRAELAQQSPSPEIYLASAIVDGSLAGLARIHRRRRSQPMPAARQNEIKAGGADFVKVYSRISGGTPTWRWADEAKQQHIPFEGHVPDAVTAQEASAAGQRSIEHLQGIALACSARQDALMGDLERVQFFRDRLAIEADGYRTLDRAKCQALFAEFRQNEHGDCQPFSVLRVWGRLDDPHFTSDPRLAYIGRKSLDRWHERTEPQMRRWNSAMYQMARGVFAADQRAVGGMFRAGVPIMAGTDAMNPYCFPGFSLHDELATLVESA